MKTKERFSSALCCSVRSVAYDFESRKGRLDMLPGCCCDMGGCILLFRAIDPEARRLETYAGDLRDTVYERDNQDRWRARTRDGRCSEWNLIPPGHERRCQLGVN
jgi:hypothetical protein